MFKKTIIFIDKIFFFLEIKVIQNLSVENRNKNIKNGQIYKNHINVFNYLIFYKICNVWEIIKWHVSTPKSPVYKFLKILLTEKNKNILFFLCSFIFCLYSINFSLSK